MSRASEIQSCEQVGPELIEASFDPDAEPHPAQRVLHLLERMARVAKPNAGAHRILVVLARLAQVDWIEGRLEVTMRDFSGATEFDVRIDDGRLPRRWRAFSVAVPLVEFAEWLKKSPSAVKPLAPFGEPVAEEIRLRVPSKDRPSTPSPSSSGRTNVHSKQTTRIEKVRVPDEARRTQPKLEAPTSPTASERPIADEESWDWD